MHIYIYVYKWNKIIFLKWAIIGEIRLMRGVYRRLNAFGPMVDYMSQSGAYAEDNATHNFGRLSAKVIP